MLTTSGRGRQPSAFGKTVTPMESFFEAFRQMTVMVIGDVMIDQYLVGSVERISPEAPVPVVGLQHRTERLGGAANVALNLAAMGARPLLYTLVGEDAAAGRLKALLPAAGLSADGLLAVPGRVTTVKTRVMAGSQQLLRIDEEQVRYLSVQEEALLWQRIEERLSEEKVDIILLQDYNKGVLSEGLIARSLAAAAARGIPVAVDPKEKNFWAYRGATLFKPNLKEIQRQLDFPIDSSLTTLDRANELIRHRLGNQYTMITLSDKGLYLADGEGSAIFPTQVRQVTDVCGAGDTVISIAALCLAAGLGGDAMAQLSNLAGGQVCEKAGVVSVDRHQLADEYAELLRGGNQQISRRNE